MKSTILGIVDRKRYKKTGQKILQLADGEHGEYQMSGVARKCLKRLEQTKMVADLEIQKSLKEYGLEQDLERQVKHT